jgi:hypothetical protein
LSILQELKNEVGLSLDEIGDGLATRANTDSKQVKDIGDWIENPDQIPNWVGRAAGLWIVELWLKERDTCGPQHLLSIDEKYTQLLRNFSMTEIIEFRNQLSYP